MSRQGTPGGPERVSAEALLEEARSRGFSFEVVEARLIVRGPLTEDPLGLEILSQQDALLELLGGKVANAARAATHDTDPGGLVAVEPLGSAMAAGPPPLRAWLARSGKRDDEIQRARLRLDAVEEEIRTFARSRWGEEADRWPAPILAGLYARDVAAGLKAVLEPWPGWERVQDGFNNPTGPELIAAVWAAYGELQPEVRQRVMDAGDRSESPPGNAPGSTGAGHG